MKYKKTTNEFSFMLKPSKYGVGVFATHGIKAGTYLRLFGDEFEIRAHIRHKKDVPELFRQYPIEAGELLFCPEDFSRMEIGWYLNHSKKPNAKHHYHRNYAARDILAGEEITIDYNSLGEPDKSKAAYYRK